MEELVRSGADMSHFSHDQLLTPDENGKTALHYAAKWDRPDVIRLIHSMGGCLQVQTCFFFPSPMALAILCESQRAAMTLFSLGVSPNGWTCAEYAHFYFRSSPLARLFILHGELPPSYMYPELVKWRRQFCACRDVVVAWLSIKRHRIKYLLHVDRFLMREMAKVIWQTRGSEEWK